MAGILPHVRDRMGPGNDRERNLHSSRTICLSASPRIAETNRRGAGLWILHLMEACFGPRDRLPYVGEGQSVAIPARDGCGEVLLALVGLLLLYFQKAAEAVQRAGFTEDNHALQQGRAGSAASQDGA